MEKQTVMDRLRQHAENMHSSWRTKAEWRRSNRSWISQSQSIAVKMLSAMREQDLTQSAVAERMGCKQQYVSKVLKGHENLSLETVVKIENALGIRILVSAPMSYQEEIEKDSHVSIVAEDK